MKKLLIALLSLSLVALADEYVIFDISVPHNDLSASTNSNGPWTNWMWSSNYSCNVVGFFKVGDSNVPPELFWKGTNVTISFTVTNVPSTTNQLTTTTNSARL